MTTDPTDSPVPGREVTRASFEAWAEREGFNIDRDDSEKYRDYHRATTRWAWQAWQARAAEADAQLAALREAAQGLRVAGQALYNRHNADTMAAWRAALATFDRVAGDN